MNSIFKKVKNANLRMKFRVIHNLFSKSGKAEKQSGKQCEKRKFIEEN
jgi:hypothetical protein